MSELTEVIGSAGLLLVLTLLALGWLLREPLAQAWRRRRLAQQPFPAAWRAVLRQHWPYFRRMPADLQLQLKKRMQVFLAEKPIIGCGGLEVTDEMRVLIAAQACLLLLNRSQSRFDGVRQILLYPGAFWVQRPVTQDGGVQHEQRRALSGESWVQGQVILSWDDVLRGAADAGDGQNVVIHEFAHQLDQAKGAATGLPADISRWQRARWAAVMSGEYAAHQQRAAAGQVSLLSDYAVTDPAEFFAVASEVFFEQAEALSQQHPALYEQLSRYYRLNLLSWS
ncbi:M90 family metallopeptidase [Ideonella paludis]|uniref:M90 family metallopeptidase n=1 Tax=Ideonella paludis TaxID=1233411 RepID=UPI0028732B87|nr:zinc-dependent peptidase [Ideonella paludis]